MDIFTQEVLSSFNKLDYDVYNYILKNSEKIPYMTIREFADEAHVSTTTILRFCKKLNCLGYSEFKVRYKMSKPTNIPAYPINTTAPIYNFLERASSEEFEQNINTISRALHQAKTLIFVGSGNSGVMAKYAASYFSSVGKFALYIENPMFELNVENPRESAVIVFSVSGETSMMIPNLSLLKEKQAVLVSITNGENNTMARMSDYHIAYHVQNEKHTKPGPNITVDITSQVPVIYIIETLAKKTYNLGSNQGATSLK